MKIVRTPEDRFTNLPDFVFVPRYAQVTHDDVALRMAYLDEGSGPVMLLLHGEPSWSFLYRSMVPPLVEAGFRVVAPDLIGFGRSDKPVEADDYTYARHVGWLRSLFFDTLDLRDITLFCQDWGGLLGLRLVGEHPERFSRVCAANTGLPDGTRKMGEAWWRFHDFVKATPDLPIGTLMSFAVTQPMTPEVIAAYDAPFPDVTFKAGARTLPMLIPQSLDDPATPANQAAWTVLEKWTKPFLCLFSDNDPITTGGDQALLARIPGTANQPHATVPGGHFLQEESGPELVARLITWMADA